MSQSAFDSALISLADMYQYLGQPLPAAHDGNLEAIIRHISASISSHCGRKFETATHTQVLDGSGISTLKLPHWPVTFTTGQGVWVDPDGIFGDDTELELRDGTVTTWDFYALAGEDGQGILKHRSSWPCAAGSVKAIWTGGYAVDQIPDQVKFACKWWCAVELEVARKGLHTIQSEGLPAGSGTVTIFEQKVPEKVQSWLMPFLRRTFL